MGPAREGDVGTGLIAPPRWRQGKDNQWFKGRPGDHTCVVFKNGRWWELIHGGGIEPRLFGTAEQAMWWAELNGKC